MPESAPRPIDVGLVAHNAVHQDGQGRAMVELAKALATAGHRVTVHTRRLAPELEPVVEWRRLPRDLGVGLLDDFFILAAATWSVRRCDHDVVVGIGPVVAPRCRFVFEAQFAQLGWRASWDDTSRPSRYHRLHNATAAWLEQRVVRRADVLMPTTSRLGDEVAGNRPLPTVVVPNGVDVDEYQPVGAEERRTTREALGIPADARVVGFLGEYHTGRKGLGPLVAAAALGDEHVAVGGSGDTDWLASHAASHGATGRVHALGFRPSREVIAASDVVAVPSVYEPFSLVALEAAASSVPVVVSHVAGAAGHLGDGAVVLDDPRSVDEIRNALDKVADPDVAAAMGHAARAAAERLAWPLVMRRAVALVEGLAAGRSGAAMAAEMEAR